jgi:4-amino-4-deoxychorismate lyase
MKKAPRTYFETIKCEDQNIFNLEYHQKRIARTIGKNINLAEYIYPITDELLKCKVVYDKDDILDIVYSPYIPRVIKSFRILTSKDIEYKYKATNRDDIEYLYKKRENCDEIIIVKNGLITDTSIANIAIFENNIWLTPKVPLLQGTVRDKLLDENYIKESNITLSRLLKAKRIALMNAMIGFKVIEKFSLTLQ